MNANQIISMLTRMFFRKFMNRGIDAGVKYATRGKPESTTPEEDRERTKSARETGKRARQAAKLMRRMGRM
jgi:hypothetical protein